MVDSTKDPINPTMYKGVYSIPCSCGQVYIEERGRSFGIGLKEHNIDLRWKETKNSTLLEHPRKLCHIVCLGEAKDI